MKKVLSVVLAFVMVLAVASFAMAATVSYTGSVKAEYNTFSGLNNGYNDTYFTVDYTKDFQNGWSAGAKLDVWGGKASPDTDGDGDTLLKSAAVAWNGKGFVKYTADMYDVALQTGLDDGIGSAFLYNKLNDKPAVVANFKPMEGLTITGDLAEVDVDNANGKHAFDYLVKAVYSQDALTVGGGYSFINVADATGAFDTASNNDETQMGVWASYQVMDSLTVGGEYNSLSSTAEGAKAQYAYQAKATYAADPITANLSYTAKTDNFLYADEVTDRPFSSAADWFKGNLKGSEGDTFSMISADVTYKVNDTVSAIAAVDSLGKEVAMKNAKNEDVTASLGYKVAVTDTLAEGLVLEGGYKNFVDGKFYVTLTATL